MQKPRTISKDNRLARLINTQFVYTGQTGKFIGNTANHELIRKAWWISNTIKDSMSSLIDIACASGNYGLKDRGSLLIHQDTSIYLDSEAKKYLKMVEEVTNTLGFTHQTELSPYIAESKK
jgi:hypothetical protein